MFCYDLKMSIFQFNLQKNMRVYRFRFFLILIKDIYDWLAHRNSISEAGACMTLEL